MLTVVPTTVEPKSVPFAVCGGVALLAIVTNGLPPSTLILGAAAAVVWQVMANAYGLAVPSPLVIETFPLAVPTAEASHCTVNVVVEPAATLVAGGDVTVKPLGTTTGKVMLNAAVPVFWMV